MNVGQQDTGTYVPYEPKIDEDLKPWEREEIIEETFDTQEPLQTDEPCCGNWGQYLLADSGAGHSYAGLFIVMGIIGICIALFIFRKKDI